jgi:glyceraldehyde-3-phosphate dehydrogenase/erythrose-4-phosphate dehydrogenase
VLDGALRVDEREIPVFAETDPAALPWGDVGAEVVIESSGHFRDRAGAAKHLEAGARKVIVSAPAKDPDVTWRWASTSTTRTSRTTTTSSPTPPA